MDPLPLSDETDISDADVARASEGHADAVNKCLAFAANRLPIMIRARLGNRTGARDIANELAQEALVGIVRNQRRLGITTRQRYLAYLSKAATNKVIDFRGDLSQKIPKFGQGSVGDEAGSFEQSIPSSDTTPSRRARRTEFFERLFPILKNLGREDENIIIYKIFDDLSNDEIAERLCIRKKDVANFLAEALRRLVKEYKKKYPNSGDIHAF